MADETKEEVKVLDEEVNVFDDNADKIVLDPQFFNIKYEEPVKKEEEKIVDEKKDEVIDVKKDPTTEEKDKNITEEKPVVTKTNEPEKIPTATPKDIPARTEEDKKLVEPKDEFKFANKTSENIFNLLKEGKEEDVYNYLNQKQVLKNLDKMPAPEVIKLQLKNEHKDYTAQDIQDLYEERFTAPEKPQQYADELDPDFEARQKKYETDTEKFNRRLEREAKSSKNELLKLNESLVLPDIPKPQAQENKPTQEELAKAEKAREDYLNSIDGGLNEFNSIDATYKDKDVEIKATYKISAEEKKELKSDMENFNLNKFAEDRWFTKDGKFNTQQMAKDLFLLKHGDKAIEKIANEVGSKRYKEAIKNTKNVDYSGQSRSGVLEPNLQEEYDKAANHFFSN